MSESQNLRMPTNHIDRLPVELLRRMFKFATDHDNNRWSSFDTSRCPWILTGICRQWNSISIGTPNLWNNIRFSFNIYTTRPPRSSYGRANWDIYKELIQLQIKRSNPIAIDVHLSSSDWSRYPHLNALINDLRDNHHRWRSVYLDDTRGGPRGLLGIFATLGQTPLPLLEELSIQVSDRTGPQSSWFRDDNFFKLVCPKLRRGSFQGMFPSPNSLPWEQMEELSYGHWGLASWFPEGIPMPLARLSNLKILTLEGHGSKISETLNKGHIILPKLEFLEVLNAAAQTFHLITAPALQTIRFCPMRPSESSILKPFIQRSHCTVLSLLVHRCLDMDVLSDLLEENPELRHLELLLVLPKTDNAYGRSERFARMMKERYLEGSGQFKFCPHLTTLVLDDISFEKFNVDAILSVAEERKLIVTDEGEKGDGRFEELVLNGIDPGNLPSNDCSFETRMVRLKQEGMIVQVNRDEYIGSLKALNCSGGHRHGY